MLLLETRLSRLHVTSSLLLLFTQVMGHSAGEVPAAYASGLLTLDEAVGVVYHRSLEQQRLAGSGRMLAIGMDARAASDLLTAHASDLEGVELACINSPRSVVLAGPAAALARFTDLLPQGCFHALIPGNIAFHCKLTEPIVHSLMKRLAKVLPSASAWKTRHASVPLISTVTGKLHDGPLDAKYWVDNVRHAVRFQDVRTNNTRWASQHRMLILYTVLHPLLHPLPCRLSCTMCSAPLTPAIVVFPCAHHAACVGRR
jgi:acyl transferase domain-containing protein